MKILFVCLGNICRSPMAEGIFRHLIVEKNLAKKFTHDSCGTGGWHSGEPPDLRAQACLKSKGIDISDLRARQFAKEDFENFDLILVADDQNFTDVLRLAESETQKNKVKKILSFHPEMKSGNVPDPYYGKADGFEHVYQQLSMACENILLTT